MKEVQALLVAQINPLSLSTPNESQTFADTIFNYLFIGEEFGQKNEIVSKRRKRLEKTTKKIAVIPVDQRLSDKLVSPLRHAYASFLVGNFLSTLALCATIGEMLAIFKFEITNFKIAEREFKEDDQKNLFGKKFEELGQERRTNILKSYGLINEDAYKNLEKIRKIRNKYLHYWSKDHNFLENDAYQVFVATIDIVVSIFPQSFENGVFKIHPDIIKYLEREKALVPKQNVAQANN